MNRTSLFVAVCATAPFFAISAAEFTIGNHHFTVAEGFEIELVAGPPLVERPIVADFDERGRLYVADSAGSNDKVEKQLQERPHRIVWIEDSDGDGRFDKSKVFADKMMFPEGVLWFNGAVYSGAPPSIWKLEDTDGDGVADKRAEWFQGKTLTGCANDLHGPYLGPDGWIYWCKGAFAKQTHERPGQPTISDSAAHIFRCRPDGTGFDSVMSGGMDNPVEIAFTATGEPIFTTTFYTNPQGGKRDALVHSIYGSVFPKVHGVLDGLKRTGDLMPALTHLGPAAPSGLTCYRSTRFGRDYEGNLFSSQFNLHKVQRHVLEPMGATFKTRDSDFVVSDNPDFHPTDVLEDADGSLLIVDTGGWYKLCCPTSQLAKPEVLGAIYRVRRKGIPRLDDPRGLKLKWNASPAELARRLDDERFAVRNRAVAELAKPAAIPVLLATVRKSPSVEARRNAVWALTRIEASEARAAVRAALSDSDATVQQVAAHSAGLHQDAAAADALRKLLKADGALKRQAATALGQIGDQKSTGALLEAARNLSDRALEHSLIYALIQLGNGDAARAGLKDKDPAIQRVALISLDQMNAGQLHAETVVPLLNSGNPRLKETAGWIVAHHSEWAGDLRAFFKQQLQADSKGLESQLVQFMREQPIQDLITDELSNSPAEQMRVSLLNAIAQANIKKIPTSWGAQAAMALQDRSDRVSMAGLRAARTLHTTNNHDKLDSALISYARITSHAVDSRLEALSLLPAGSPLEQPLFDFAIAQIDPATPPLHRVNAATVLGRSKLSEEQLMQVTAQLAKAGPLELNRLLPAYDTHPTEEIGVKFVMALKDSKGLSALPPDTLRTRLAKFPPTVQSAGQELVTALTASDADKKKRLDEFEASLPQGDFKRGHLIFNNTKAACATCHAIGYVGGQIGPDLTRIGSIRTQRDLLEAIVYPSASFARGFEPMIITTKGNDEYSGLVRRETSDSLVMVSGPIAEQQIARSEISQMRPGTVSVMPEGLDQQLTRQEMADLVAFLRALK